MKILKQAAIIAAVCAAAELIKYLLPLPIPASVYGLILMLLALLTGLLRPEQIETAADFLIVIMPVLLLGIVGTALVIGLGGKAAEAVGRREQKRREEKHHE